MTPRSRSSIPASSCLTDITVCHRSDGSGTTYIFVDYLSKVSPAWAKGVGKSTSLKWNGGLGGKGNEGVTALVQQTPGAIGYIELIYALNNHIPFADMQNHEGRVRHREPRSVTAAAAAARLSNMPADFRVFDHRRPGRRFLSDLIVHLSARVSAANRQSQGRADHRTFSSGCCTTASNTRRHCSTRRFRLRVVALEDKQVEEIQLPK